MICMKMVKSYNPETWDCVFFEQGDYLRPIMILPEWMLKKFYEEMDRGEITEKALSGLVGIIAGVIIFFCFIYPLIIKIAKVYNSGQE